MNSILQINAYRSLINLDQPYERYQGDYKNQEEMVNELTMLFQLLKNECGYDYYPPNFTDSKTVMQFLKPFLNMREPSPLSEKLYSLIDHFLSHLSHQKEIVDANLIPNVKQSYPKTHINNSEIITLWRGDITCLKIDAIVNAANSQLLGCFQPSHLCIDNVIHTYAGPRLRDDCYKIMTAQGFEEPTGNAKITRAYNLPSKFVIHTVGPIYENSRKNKCKKMLESCYIRSLEVASSVEGVKSIAFCCISTGIFGYPQKDAAEVAIDTVDKWLTNNPGKFEKVVFNVFTEKDFLIYKSILSGN